MRDTTLDTERRETVALMLDFGDLGLQDCTVDALVTWNAGQPVGSQILNVWWQVLPADPAKPEAGRINVTKWLNEFVVADLEREVTEEVRK